MINSNNRDRHKIVTELSEEIKLKMEIIESLMEPCDRKTYTKKLKKSSKKTWQIKKNSTKISQKMGRGGNNRIKNHRKIG